MISFLTYKNNMKKLIIFLVTLMTILGLSYAPKVYKYDPATGLWQRVNRDVSEVVTVLPPLSGVLNSPISSVLEGAIVVQPSNNLQSQLLSSITTKAGQWYYYIEYQIKNNTSKSYYGVIAGQSYNIGTTTLWNDGSNIYMEFELIGGWVALESHLNLTDEAPTDNQSPGLFPYKRTYNQEVTQDEYTVSYVDQGFQIGQKIYILLHLSVKKGGQKETAWSGGEPPSDVCINISNTGSLWYVRKPGKYMASVFEITVNTSHAVVVTFSNFDNLQPQGGIGVETISIFYAVNGELPSNFEWTAAPDLNNRSVTLNPGSSSLNFYQLVDLKTQSWGIYKNVGTITFTLQNTKVYIDRK